MADVEVIIAGRPNVGKSSLFNRLLGRRRAICDKTEGATRDIVVAPLQSEDGGRQILLADSGGFWGEGGGARRNSPRKTRAADDEDVARAAAALSARRAESAALVLLVVDAQAGLQPYDNEVAAMLRRARRRVLLVANKCDNLTAPPAEFLSLGFGEALPVSAAHGHGVASLRRRIFSALEDAAASDENISPSKNEIENENENEKIDSQKNETEDENAPPKVAIVGRPNVGKSSLLNLLAGGERALVSAVAGTTRDEIDAEIVIGARRFIIVDTAGLRRARAGADALEKLAAARGVAAMERADVVVLMTDAHAALPLQDRRLAAMAQERGKPVILAVNKMDTAPPHARKGLPKKLESEFPFTPAAVLTMSAGRGRAPRAALAGHIVRAAKLTAMEFGAGRLNRILRKIVAERPPPSAGRLRPKLRYAHQGGRRPVTLILHGGAVGKIGESYRRYLCRAFSRELKMTGAPLRVVFRAGGNPYVEGG